MTSDWCPHCDEYFIDDDDGVIMTAATGVKVWAAIEEYRYAATRLTELTMRALAGFGSSSIGAASVAMNDAEARLRELLGMEPEP